MTLFDYLVSPMIQKQVVAKLNLDLQAPRQESDCQTNFVDQRRLKTPHHSHWEAEHDYISGYVRYCNPNIVPWPIDAFRGYIAVPYGLDGSALKQLNYDHGQPPDQNDEA